MSELIELQLLRGTESLTRTTISCRPIVVGSSSQCDLVVPSDEAHRALVWLEGGQLWIRDLDGQAGVYVAGKRLSAPTPLAGEESISLGESLKLQINRSSLAGRFPYRMTITQRGSIGMEVRVDDLHSDQQCVVRSQNRTAMLYLLARQLAEDTESNLPLADRGWCTDEAIACGVWGRQWKERLESHFYVLLHRVRRKLEGAGLDPRCIEKRRRHSRAWVQEVVLQ